MNEILVFLSYYCKCFIGLCFFIEPIFEFLIGYIAIRMRNTLNEVSEVVVRSEWKIFFELGSEFIRVYAISPCDSYERIQTDILFFRFIEDFNEPDNAGLILD